MRVWPEYIDLKYFADQLVAEYFNADIPILIDEGENTKWIPWAAAISAIPIFAIMNVPSPSVTSGGEKRSQFNSWRDWAKAAYICMNNSNPVA